MQAIQNQENKIVYNPGSFTLNSLKEISFDNQNENQKSNEKSLEYTETQKILD